jgi:metal-responsive CopG/Arc/MetJ family transcriptional regulator
MMITRKVVSVSLPIELTEAVERWRNKQIARPSRSVFFEIALAEWIKVLDRREKRRQKKS